MTKATHQDADATAKSLRIIQQAPGLRPAEFARRYFPENHEGWSRISKCGPYGSTSGGGLILWAGGWLGKLRKRGLIDSRERLTPAGKAYLNDIKEMEEIINA